MGQLIAVPEFRERRYSGDRSHAVLDSFWYFEDATDHFSERFKVEKTYPHTLYVHVDWLIGHEYMYDDTYGLSVEAAGRLRVEMRRWIEDNIHDVVMYSKIIKSYFRAYFRGKGERGWMKEIRHDYYKFYFKNLEDATLFKLQFGQYAVAEIGERHPQYPKSDDTLDTLDASGARGAVEGYYDRNNVKEI